jgi:hypothetical protein
LRGGVVIVTVRDAHAQRAGRVIAESFDAFSGRLTITEREWKQHAPDADVVLQFAAFGEVIYG